MLILVVDHLKNEQKNKVKQSQIKNTIKGLIKELENDRTLFSSIPKLSDVLEPLITYCPCMGPNGVEYISCPCPDPIKK